MDCWDSDSDIMWRSRLLGGWSKAESLVCNGILDFSTINFGNYHARKCLRTLPCSTYVLTHTENKFMFPLFRHVSFDVVIMWAIIIRWSLACFFLLTRGLYSIAYIDVASFHVPNTTNQFLFALSLDPILGCVDVINMDWWLLVVAPRLDGHTRWSRTRSQYLGHWRRAVDIAAAAYQPRPMIPTVQVGCGTGGGSCLPNYFNGFLCKNINGDGEGGLFCFHCHQRYLPSD